MGGFKRGNKKKKLGLVKPDVAKAAPSPVDLNAAGESAKDLENLPIEVEHIKHLQRQAKNSGMDMRAEKLKREQETRDEYNHNVAFGEADDLYGMILPPVGSVVIKLFKKPIFELNGFLKPDMIKKVNEKTGGVYYVENRFPYLDCGVIVNQNGLHKQFGEDAHDAEGALITLKPKVRLDNYVYFIDKTDITPTYFEGHVCVPAYEIESIVAFKGDDLYGAAIEKMLGKTGNQMLQAKIDKEAEEANEVIADQVTDENNEENENA